jgi:hypothetical protein
MIGAREALAIACSTQFDAAAPSGGMVVVMGVWGMPAAVMVQVRVGGIKLPPKRKGNACERS